MVMTASEIIPSIYVGDMLIAQNPSFFQQAKIKTVINCTVAVPCYFEDKGVRYYRIPVNDTPRKEDNDIMAKAIPQVLDIVRQLNLSKENALLIHCAAGVSRSCTVATAIVRACCSDSIPQAVSMVVARRPIAFFSGRYVNFYKALQSVFEK